jgi:hypothetical protein
MMSEKEIEEKEEKETKTIFLFDAMKRNEENRMQSEFYTLDLYGEAYYHGEEIICKNYDLFEEFLARFSDFPEAMFELTEFLNALRHIRQTEDNLINEIKEGYGITKMRVEIFKEKMIPNFENLWHLKYPLRI